MWNLVYFISIAYSVVDESGTLLTTKRLQRTGVQKVVTIPAMAYFYNVYKAAVDQFDRYFLNTSYSVIECRMRAHRWWPKIYWGLVDGGLSNA